MTIIVTRVGIPRTADEARAVRQAWSAQHAEVRSSFEAGDLSEEKRDALHAAIGHGEPPFPAGYTLAPCPSWCSTDHADKDLRERTDGARVHERCVGQFLIVDHSPVTVDVFGFDNLDRGIRHPATVVINDQEFVNAAEARRFAAAVLRAADLADSW